MSLFENAINCIAIFIILILATFYLRAKGILKSSNAPKLSRLITELVLPAYLFRQLAFADLSMVALKAAGGLILAEITLALIAYPIGKYLLKLTSSTLALFVLCSTFSSTGLLGNSFLKLIYDMNSNAIADGIIIGQLAITTPNYFITPAILSRFQSSNKNTFYISNVLASFLNPPNIAIILGLLWAILDINTSGYILDPIFDSMRIIGDTIPFLTALSIGLSLSTFPDRKDLYAILFCSLSVLIAEPLIVYLINLKISEPFIDKQVSFLLASLPAAQVIAVYAIRYEVNPKFASTLIAATTVLSAISIPSLLFIFKVMGM